jgi:hypothetical protein
MVDPVVTLVGTRTATNWLLTLLAHVLQRDDRRLVPDDVAGLVRYARDHAFSGTR